MVEKGNNIRYIIVSVIVGIVFVIFCIQLINWQLVNGEKYREKADSNSVYSTEILPARGEILDTNGVDLAINVIGHNVVFNKAYLKMGTENEVILRLIRLFNDKGQPWIDELPINIDENGNYYFTPGKDSQISKLKSDYRLNSYATAQDCINIMSDKKWFDCANMQNVSESEKRDIISVRYNMNKMGYNYETNYIFAETVNDELISIILENNNKFPGVQVSNSPTRKYVNGTLAPHIVGTIGALSAEEYKDLKGTGNYKLNSLIGKSGIEKYFENYLRGTPGKQTVEMTPDGNSVANETLNDAVSGNTVYLTLDARLQKIAEQSLSDNVRQAQSQTGAQVTASVAMLKVSDFSILCAQSCPSFDLAAYKENNDYYNSVVTDKRNPLYARVFEGTYTIGSTMKPAVALAALEEGTITPSTVYSCGHRYMRFAPNYTPLCMGTHGGVALDRAMAVSCNVFFFETGYNLGITPLNMYQSRLGLGQKTGVEIYERAGILAGQKEREANGGIWYDGDTVAAAIGQSDNLITPIQLATYCATIANNGVRLRTHLVKKITDYSRQNVILENDENNAEVMDNVQVSEKNMKTVQSAMRGVVTRSDGTAFYSFGTYEIPIAAKTGTAENTDNSPDHTTLIAYAPYENPQVALGIVIEHGKVGTWAANIAKALFDGYFKNINMEPIPKTNIAQ